MTSEKFKQFLCSTLGKICMIVILYAIILTLLLGSVNLFSDNVILVFAVVFAFFGWKALNRITPDIFVIMPIVGWLFYFCIKGALAVVIGMFVTPFVISKKITSVIQNNIQ